MKAVLGFLPFAIALSAAGAQMDARLVDGKVQLGKRSAPVPVAGLWVVVHRIISDPSGQVGGGPVDSAKTGANGRYSIRYRVPRNDSATYLAITQYKGIAYIAGPLRGADVTGDDAAILVFDTTSAPFPLRVAGRHFVVAGPTPDGRRRVVEVYELMNDSTLTVVGTETHPVWRAPLPKGIGDFQLNPMGDVTANSVKQTATGLDVFAPISPGIRQLSFSYTLPSSAFPLVLASPDSVELMELLIQEQTAAITGGGLQEVAPVSQQGQTFRRLMAANIGRNTPVELSLPRFTSGMAKDAVSIVATVLGAAMLLMIGVALKRRRPLATQLVPLDPTASLIQRIASIDVDLERRSDVSDAERAHMRVERESLKSRLAAALADRGSRG